MENQTQTPQNQKDIEENKAIAFLSYLGILFLIPLLAKPKSKFSVHHAKNGLVIFIAWLIIGVVSIIPFLGWFVAVVGTIILFIFSIVGIVKALHGEFWEMPFLGQYTKHFNL